MTGRGLLIVLIYTMLVAGSACDMGPGDAMDSYRGSGDPLFVAVANDGKSYISEDGMKWKLGGSIGTDTIFAVTYGQGKFVGISNSLVPVWISSDGKNWVSYSSLETGIDAYVNSISYNKGLFVAGGVDGGNSKVFYSTNGINWYPGAGIDIGEVNKIAYGNEMFFAIPANIASISRSYDGKNWQDQSASESGDFFHDVAYGNTMFVIVGVIDPEEGLIRISQTGNSNNWSDNLVAGIDASFQSIIYRNKTFVALGVKNIGNAGVVYTSGNGFTWEGPFATYQDISKITYGNGVLVVVGNNGLIAYSKDGRGWSANVGPGGSIYINDVCFRP